MFDRNERKVGLGWTEDGERVVAHVSIESGSDKGTSVFTDHTEGAAPDRVSVSFEVIGGKYRSQSFGQIPTAERVIVRSHANDADESTRAFIDELWSTHHLNDMQAACDHMTPDMLARHEGESGQDWQHRMLDTVVCPVTGYKWGHAWLARAVSSDVLAKARRIVASGRI
ncbi:hypothetical protein SEA_BIG4_365 [Microbacterium phage Big4]|nr:hypothetical protein SEA_BIG4_39 [Microbacterium phage Big4]URP22398.1 hypothetical protein SEA_BIG4_365 [Microbacterium phage Big4]